MHEDYATGDWVKALEYLGRGRPSCGRCVAHGKLGIATLVCGILLSERGELAQGLATSARSDRLRPGDRRAQVAAALGAVRRWPDPHHAGRSRKGRGAPAPPRAPFSRRHSPVWPPQPPALWRSASCGRDEPTRLGLCSQHTKSASARTASRDRFSAVCAAPQAELCLLAVERADAAARVAVLDAQAACRALASSARPMSAHSYPPTRFTGTYEWLRGDPRRRPMLGGGEKVLTAAGEAGRLPRRGAEPS